MFFSITRPLIYLQLASALSKVPSAASNRPGAPAESFKTLVWEVPRDSWPGANGPEVWPGASSEQSETISK